MRRWSLLTLTVALLAGCEGTLQQRLGLERQIPDEFQTVRHRPLVIPEDFTLPPPRTAAAATPRDRQEAEVQGLLLGRERDGEAPLDSGDRALLAAMPERADPAIRQQLAEEERRRQSRRRFLFVLPGQKEALGLEGEALDPVAEARRLAADPRVRRVITVPQATAARDGGGS